MVTAIDGVQQPSFTTFPLATGPYLSEDGHDGVLHISSPACPTQLLLNYSNWQNPTISGATCHTWSMPVGNKGGVAKRPSKPAPAPKPVKKHP
jgi:hypothetical protein